MTQATDNRTKRSLDFDGALNEAVRDVALKKESLKAAEEGQRPKSSTPFLAAVIVMLSAVIVWDLFVFARPPEAIPAPELEANLRFEVRQLVQEVEAFRQVEARLPTSDELGPLVDELVTYRANEESYFITAADEGVEVRYDGSEPIDTWMMRSETGADS